MFDLLLLVLVVALLVGGCALLSGYITGCDPLHWAKGFRGYTKIQLYDGQYDFNESFTTWAKFDKDGNVVGPVYWSNLTKIGIVKLNKDGTAEHNGKYKWRKI